MAKSYSTARLGLRVGASLIALLAPTGVWAQTAPTQGAGAPAATPNDNDLEEIVVTAQRREERLQEVPIAITALTGDELRRTDTTDIGRLDKFVPGFNFGKSGLDARPAIRGVRTENVAGNGDPTIGFYVDDVYQSRATQAGQPFIDVKRVEVQRGPQGTLFGRNTFGGAVSVITAVPTNEFEWRGDVTVGNYSRIGAQGMINVPMSSTAGVRFAGFREKRDGWVKNIALRGNDLYEKDTTFLRGTLRFEPGPDWEVIVRGNYWHEGGNAAAAFGYKPAGILVNPATGVRSLDGVYVPFISTVPRDGIADFNGFDLGFKVDPDPYVTQTQLPARARLNQYAGSAQVRWSNDSIFVRSITSYQVFNYFANSGAVAGVPVDDVLQTRESEAISQELQIGGARSKPFQWIAGLFYFDDQIFDEFRIDRLNVNDGGFAGAFPVRVDVKSYAAYAQGSYYVLPAVRLTAGGRYTIDQKEFDADNFSIVRGIPRRTSGLDAQETFKKFTYRLGADFFPAPDNMIYASLSTGFRSGGFNGGAGTNPLIPASFGPENVKAYELGSKNRFADGRIQLNVAAYYNDFTDLQVQNQFLVGTTTLSAIRNAGEAYSRGIEIEALARPTSALTLNATANFVKARYETYVTSPPPGYAGSFLSLKGNRIPYTPSRKFTAGARYEIDLGTLGTLTPQADAIFSGSYFNTDYNTVIDLQKSYTKVDLRLSFLTRNERYSVDAFVENVGNVAVANRGVFGSTGLNKSFETPRFFGLRFGIRS